MGRAPGDPDPLDRPPTATALLAFAPIGTEPVLEVAEVAEDVAVALVFQRRPAVFDGLADDVPDRLDERFEIGSSE